MLLDLARRSDLVFVGEDEAEEAWGMKGAEAIRAALPEPDVLVVKRGSDGAAVFSDAGEADDVTTVPALRVDVVAPVGAGDAFAAGFLSATLRDLPVRDRVRHGHLMAAAVLTVPGDLTAPAARAHADALAALDDEAWGDCVSAPGGRGTTRRYVRRERAQRANRQEGRPGRGPGRGQRGTRMSQTVDRALSILPLLAQGPADLGQVAERLGVHKSTALRLLRTLHEHGLVYRQQDQRYRLGARLFALAQEAVENLDVREIAHPHLVELNESCGHTVHLAVYEEHEVLYIDKVESRYPVRMYSRIGKPVAITVAAVAKLLLADLTEPERRAIAEKLDYPMYTSRSIPNAGAFLKELAVVREQGWATDLGGHEESINCIGAPIRGADGRVVAAMSVSAPNVVVTAEELLTLLPLVRRTADTISREYSGTNQPKKA